MIRYLMLCLAVLGTSTAFSQVGGIAIDADGVAQSRVVKITKAAAEKIKTEARSVEGPLGQSSDRRFVSLKAVLGEDANPAAERMAGLVRVDVMVADEAAGDVLLGGRAEPAAVGPSGRVIGIETGRPVVTRSQVIEAFQFVAGGGGTYGCSIDATPEGLTRLKGYLAKNSSAAKAATLARRYQGMAGALGMQDVRVFGVAADSPLGVLAVEADLVMKEIALGKRRSGVRAVPSHLQTIRPNGNNLQRWWFAPRYESIAADEDGTTFTLSGPRLKLLAQDEIADAGGVRSDAATTAESTEAFARRFSENMDAVATQNEAIAALQNVTDLLVLAELIRQERLTPGGFDVLNAAARLPKTEPVANAPKQIPAAATTRRAGRMMLGLVGGVTVEPRAIVREFRTDGGETVTPPDVDGWFADAVSPRL